MSTAPDERKPFTLVVNVALIGLTLGLVGTIWTGAWYMSQQSAQATSLTERVKQNNDATTDRLNQIIVTLNEKVLSSAVTMTDRQGRIEKDLAVLREQVERRFEVNDRRNDEQSRVLSLGDGRLTRLEAQREFGQATGVRR